MAKSEKQSTKRKPKVHKELDGFEMSIDSFGEIHSSLKIEKLNEFLNKNVDDKKLLEREDQKENKKIKKKEKQ